MGRVAQVNRIVNDAEYDQLVGPIRDFGARVESGCQKCAAPASAFVVRWCTGKNILSTSGNQSGMWTNACVINSCPVIGEHLHVLCQNCHYGWNEHTKEYAPE